MTEWRLTESMEFKDPFWSMAIEEALFEKVAAGLSSDTLRFWVNRNAVVIGRFQCPKDEVVIGGCSAQRAMIVRRFSGGGTVYQDTGNLNFSVFIKKDLGISAKTEVFDKIGRVIVASLDLLGVKAKFDGKGVYVGGKKISGIAGAVAKKAIMVHSCILVNTRLEVLYNVLNLCARYRGSARGFTPSHIREVTSVATELGKVMLLSDVEEVMLESFRDAFQAVIKPGGMSAGEMAIARGLYAKKYSKLEWAFDTCYHCPERVRTCDFFRQYFRQYREGRPARAICCLGRDKDL